MIYLPGDRIHNGHIVAVVKQGDRHNDWVYLVRDACCGGHRELSHKSIARRNLKKPVQCIVCARASQYDPDAETVHRFQPGDVVPGLDVIALATRGVVPSADRYLVHLHCCDRRTRLSAEALRQRQRRGSMLCDRCAREARKKRVQEEAEEAKVIARAPSEDVVLPGWPLVIRGPLGRLHG